MASYDARLELGKSALGKLPPLSRVALKMAYFIANWEMRRATRQSLSRLSAHMLHDIGLQPEQAQSECSKPFWRE